MAPKAIYRTAKIHTLAKLNQASRHNTRANQPTHADPRKGVHVLVGTGDDPAAAVRALLPTDRRKDAVLALELLCTASPEYFRPHQPEKPGIYDQERMVEWKDRAVDWLQAEFGDNLVSVILHLDEATRHIQALVVSLDREVGRLAAKRLFGPAELTRQQDTYAEAMAPLGIERGERGSKAKHEPLRKYYKRASAPAPSPPPRRDLGPKPVPTRAEKIKAKIGLATAYDQRLSTWLMQQKAAADERREYIATLVAQAAELGDGRKADRQRRALMKLMGQIEALDAEKPGSVHEALHTLAPAERAEIAPLLPRPRR